MLLVALSNQTTPHSSQTYREVDRKDPTGQQKQDVQRQKDTYSLLHFTSQLIHSGKCHSLIPLLLREAAYRHI